MNVDSVGVLARHRGRLVLLLGALLALAAISAIVKHWWRLGEPGVRFAMTEYDFGKIPSGRAFTYEFPFRNRSGKPVTIERVHSSCGCIADDSAHQPIPDDGTGSVRVILTTHGIRPPRTLAKRLLVVFEPPEVKPVVLILRANVRPEVRCEPDTVLLKESSPGKEVSADLIVHREMLPPDEFASVLVEAPLSYYRLKDLDRTRDEYRVQVELMSERAPRTPSPLKVRYRKKGKQTHVVVPVVFQRQQHVELVPPAYVKVVSGSSSPTEFAETTKAKFVVTSPGRRQLRVLDIVPERPEDGRFLRWRIHPGIPSFEIWLSQCPPGRDSVYSTGLFVVLGDLGGSRERLRLDVRIVVTATE